MSKKASRGDLSSPTLVARNYFVIRKHTLEVAGRDMASRRQGVDSDLLLKCNPLGQPGFHIFCGPSRP